MSSISTIRSDILALIDILSKAPQDFGLNPHYTQASSSSMTPSTSSSSGMTGSDGEVHRVTGPKLEPWEDDPCVAPMSMLCPKCPLQFADQASLLTHLKHSKTCSA